MSYILSLKKYLDLLQEEYNSSLKEKQHTAELSFRMPMDQLFRDLAKDLNPEERIKVILEPKSQGRVGRPDWRIHNEVSLGIYGYIEGKGLKEETLDIKPYQKQIDKYLSLGHKLVITDGIDFIFCLNSEQNPVLVPIVDKKLLSQKNWCDIKINPQFEIYIRNFFNNPSPQHCSEEKLVELIATRTRIVADEILEYSNIASEEAIDDTEREAIELLNGIRDLVYNHNDCKIRTNRVFSDFIAQVIMFCLLYAHRVICSISDSPLQKEKKLKEYIEKEFLDDKQILPFRNIMLYIKNHSNTNTFISQWIDECIKFLSFVKITEQQILRPDYHHLFELFLSKYDPETRFDYGAFYTPQYLAKFIVELTNYVIKENFNSTSIYDSNTTIIDPCCGTGSFLEEIIKQDKTNNKYNLCGIEILPAPYMLANYRMALLKKQYSMQNININVLLANTLGNSAFGYDVNEKTIEGQELRQVNKISSRPLKLVIGNPPSSDSIRVNNNKEFSIINKLMDNFRPPQKERQARQNIQKQINNPFMQFIRWGCKKLEDSPNNSALSFVVPLSFLESESYKYARKYLIEHFSDAWCMVIDADARTGIRTNSIFNTLQGRAIIIFTRKHLDNKKVAKYHFTDIATLSKQEKEKILSQSITDTLKNFSEYNIKNDTYSLLPSKDFDDNLYNNFWPISGQKNQKAIFLNHCSGIKLAPTAAFTHIKKAMLKRRSKEIANGGAEAGKPWFCSQERPPHIEKLEAFHGALNKICSKSSIDEVLDSNIKIYSFRPFLNSNVLLWQNLLKSYAKIGGGGTRLRPEIIKAYSNKNVFGFAMAHAPKDLNPKLNQFVSFCWYYPDNDMCTRGNSHIYTNFYPLKDKNKNEFISNINKDLVDKIKTMFNANEIEATNKILFYVYAVLCSQTYLDAFEGALYTVSISDKRPRVPIVDNKEIFEQLSNIGEEIANIERQDFNTPNILNFDYKELMEQVPQNFKLKNSSSPFDEENELLIITDGSTKIEIPCQLSLQKLNISGYNVIKNVWLKFNSYEYTHCNFDKSDMKELLDLLNKLKLYIQYINKADDIIRKILVENIDLIVP